MAKPHHDPPRDLFPTDEEIAERAYELCFVYPDSTQSSLNYVEAAEDELLDRAAKRALLPVKPRRRAS